MKDKKELLDWLPLMSAYIIFLGVVRQTIFYQEFDINIIKFLEFSEILTSFLDILAIVVTISRLPVLQLYVGENVNQSIGRAARKRVILVDTNPFRRLWKYAVYYSVLSMIILFFAVIVPINDYFFGHHYWDTVKFVVIVLVAVFFISFYWRRSNGRINLQILRMYCGHIPRSWHTLQPGCY